jgi:hypothetical protein
LCHSFPPAAIGSVGTFPKVNAARTANLNSPIRSNANGGRFLRRFSGFRSARAAFAAGNACAAQEPRNAAVDKFRKSARAWSLKMRL